MRVGETIPQNYVRIDKVIQNQDLLNGLSGHLQIVIYIIYVVIHKYLL